MLRLVDVVIFEEKLRQWIEPHISPDIVIGQWPVDDHTNEIGVMQSLLLALAIEGRVITTDGLLAQKDIAETIISGSQ